MFILRVALDGRLVPQVDGRWFGSGLAADCDWVTTTLPRLHDRLKRRDRLCDTLRDEPSFGDFGASATTTTAPPGGSADDGRSGFIPKRSVHWRNRIRRGLSRLGDRLLEEDSVAAIAAGARESVTSSTEANGANADPLCGGGSEGCCCCCGGGGSCCWTGILTSTAPLSVAQLSFGIAKVNSSSSKMTGPRGLECVGLLVALRTAPPDRIRDDSTAIQRIDFYFFIYFDQWDCVCADTKERIKREKLTTGHDGQWSAPEGRRWLFSVVVAAVAPAGQRPDVCADLERESLLAHFHFSERVGIEAEREAPDFFLLRQRPVTVAHRTK